MSTSKYNPDDHDPTGPNTKLSTTITESDRQQTPQNPTNTTLNPPNSSSAETVSPPESLLNGSSSQDQRDGMALALAYDQIRRDQAWGESSLLGAGIRGMDSGPSQRVAGCDATSSRNSRATANDIEGGSPSQQNQTPSNEAIGQHPELPNPSEPDEQPNIYEPLLPPPVEQPETPAPKTGSRFGRLGTYWTNAFYRAWKHVTHATVRLCCT